LRQAAERNARDARDEAERLRAKMAAARRKPPEDGAARKEEARLREALAEAQRAAARAQEKADATAYAHGVALAGWEARAGHFDLVGPYLRECPEGLRGWEWHYLARVYGTGLVAASANKHFVTAVG